MLLSEQHGSLQARHDSGPRFRTPPGLSGNQITGHKPIAERLPTIQRICPDPLPFTPFWARDPPVPRLRR